MKNKGFYIKSVIATGKGVMLSRVDFTSGCNFLFGPSDSSKSVVFTVIEFMLGKTVSKKAKSPKDVVEGKDYDTYYMEIVTYGNGQIHTFRRYANENNLLIKDCTFEQFDTLGHKGTLYPISSKTKETFSSYLMRLNGFEDDLEVRSTTTSKEKLTFSLIRHLILTDEIRIVSENPIFNPTGQRTDDQKEKSLIYYLTTGNDDSGFVESEKADLRKSRYNGMISLTEEEIELVKDRLEKLGDVSFADFDDEGVMKVLKSKLNEEEAKLNQLYDERKEKEDRKRRLESKRLFNTEFVKRMEMLQDHYETDLSRYEYLFEGATLFNLLGENMECPFCHSRLEKGNELDEDYRNAVQEEYNRLKAKISDVRDMIVKKKQSVTTLINQIDKLQTELNTVENKIKIFSTELTSLKETLKIYQKNIEKKAESNMLASELGRLTRKLDKLNKEQKEKPSRPSYIRQTDIKEDFCAELKKKLVDWNILNESENVVFDEDEFDFILGVKGRLTCGKGSRGVTCTAILMTLVEYCHQKNIPFSNLLVLDSPITAHFQNEKVVASETTQAKFFKYLNNTSFDYQLIIIDNKSPNEEERKRLNNIHYVEFTKENGFYKGLMR